MSNVCKELMLKNNLQNDDINWLIPHQANIRIIKAVAEKLEFPLSKIKINLEKYGNTTAATIPLCLWDYFQDFKNGDKIILTAFGAGFSWGASYLIWSDLRRN